MAEIPEHSIRRVSVRLTARDDYWLSCIIEQDGHDGISSAIRMLLRQEARRRGYADTIEFRSKKSRKR